MIRNKMIYKKENSNSANYKKQKTKQTRVNITEGKESVKVTDEVCIKDQISVF